MNVMIMSCIEFVDKYAEKEQASEKAEIVNEALKCLKIQEEKRTQELYDFIDDFVNSPEYSAYINDKRNIIKKSTGSQYNANDILVEHKKDSEVEKYPLTQEQKKMYAFKQHFEDYAAKQRAELKIKKQEHSIQIIKSKINDARRIFECTWEFKQMEKEKAKQCLLNQYATKFGIDLEHLNEDTQAKLLERFKKCHEAMKLKKKRKHQNVCKMIENLVFDYKIKNQMLAREKQKHIYQMKMKEKIMEDMEVVGTKIQLIDRSKIVKPVETEPLKIEESLPEIQIVKKKKTPAGKVKEPKKEKVAKREKTVNKKAGKGKTIKEKKEKPEIKLRLPIFPIINPRQKIFPENIDKILDLVDEFRELDNAMEDSDMRHAQKNYLLSDSNLKPQPKEILFRNFDEGKTYSRTVRISNASVQMRKIRFLKFEFPDEYDEVVFEVETFGIRKLFAGSTVKFYLKFEPYDTFKPYEGKAVFLSYDIRLCQYFQLEIGIKCVPKYSNLKICPEVVQFGGIPIWKVEKCKNFKLIKFENKGVKSCTIYVKKVHDPLDLESILEEEDKENIAPAPANSTTDFNDICNILEECLETIDNVFQFELGYFTLSPLEKRAIKVFLKNATYIGYYFEKYTVDVYEVFGGGTLETAGCQTITLHAETTGHCLSTSPEALDFGTCVLNSCYQLGFEVYNESNKSQAVSVRVPSNLTDVVQPDISTIYMPPKTSRAVLVKLSPRSTITRNLHPYFDKITSILEFPIHLYVVSKTAEKYPPAKVTVYAVIANFEDLTISCSSTENLSNFLNTVLIDMGDCSIYETICTDVALTNNTEVTQVCGFMDLPEAVKLVPNFGFCKLYPSQRKKFKLYISPEIKEYPSFPIGSLRNNTYFFKIKVETVISLGQMQRQINQKRLKRSLDIMLDQLTNADNDLSTCMMVFVDDFKEYLQANPATQSMQNKEEFITSRACSLLPQIYNNSNLDTYKDDKSVDTLLNYQNFLIVETTSRKEVWFKTNLRRPLLEFSHQTVEFPDTPCGSYSLMDVTLLALEREIEKYCLRKKSNVTYKAHFHILGDSDEIFVEPSCGLLNTGDSIKITLLAKPEVPKEIVEQTARSIKYSEIYEMKLNEYLSRAKKQGQKGKGDKKAKGNKKNDKAKESKKDKNKKKDSGKNDKEKKKEEKPEDKPDIVITEKELECDYLDLYPAEMVYWRNMEPYYIKANFTCLVDYEQIQRRQDKLYLTTICKVIRPDFKTDLNVQRLDFGRCLIGMKTTKNVVLQNITYQNIKPKLSLLNPLGSFSVPYIRNVVLPAEHYLKLPIDFRPTSAEKFIEYFEIKSNATIIPLILCGEGCPTSINISPQFSVFRLETKQQKLAELQLKVDNSSEAPALVQFDKLFEIEALLADIGKAKPDKVEENANKHESDKSKTKTEKESKGKKGKDKEKVAKYSDNLTDKELEAIESCFRKIKGESHFDLKTENSIWLQPNTTHAVTVLCGNPELIKKKKLEGPKKGKKEAKTQNKTEAASDAQSDAESKKGQDTQYITQYNVHVGETFIKSIILVCTIK